MTRFVIVPNWRYHMILSAFQECAHIPHGQGRWRMVASRANGMSVDQAKALYVEALSVQVSAAY